MSSSTHCFVALSLTLLTLASCGQPPDQIATDDGDPALARALSDEKGRTPCTAKARPQPDGSYLKLSDTGLYCDIARGTIDEEARGYRLRSELWADGADKLRFLRLPPGKRIDTHDMDEWLFPAGTKVWKQFSLDGVKLETRLLEKRKDGTWFMMPFAWDDDEKDAFPVPAGVQNARGTPHDVPSTSQCVTCHIHASDVLLGVAALPLSNARPSGVTLAKLAKEGRLTDKPLTEIRFPGDAVAARALGYLYANCRHCHTGSFAPAGLDFSTSVRDDEAEQTMAYQTTVRQPLVFWTGHGYTKRIDPGHPGGSGIIGRMSTRKPDDQMPKIATEVVDDEGVQIVSDWIRDLGG